MRAKDEERVQRIMESHERGELNDLSVYAIIAAVRAEAILEERVRETNRLEALARRAQVLGQADVAAALVKATERHAWRDPLPADVSDA